MTVELKEGHHLYLGDFFYIISLKWAGYVFLNFSLINTLLIKHVNVLLFLSEGEH